MFGLLKAFLWGLAADFSGGFLAGALVWRRGKVKQGGASAAAFVWRTSTKQKARAWALT